MANQPFVLKDMFAVRRTTISGGFTEATNTCASAGFESVVSGEGCCGREGADDVEGENEGGSGVEKTHDSIVGLGFRKLDVFG